MLIGGGGLSPWLRGKESACNAGATGDADSIPGLGRSPGEGHGNLLQYSCLENPHGKRSFVAIVHIVADSDMTEVSACVQVQEVTNE